MGTRSILAHLIKIVCLNQRYIWQSGVFGRIFHLHLSIDVKTIYSPGEKKLDGCRNYLYD